MLSLALSIALTIILPVAFSPASVSSGEAIAGVIGQIVVARVIANRHLSNLGCVPEIIIGPDSSYRACIDSIIIRLKETDLLYNK